MLGKPAAKAMNRQIEWQEKQIPFIFAIAIAITFAITVAITVTITVAITIAIPIAIIITNIIELDLHLCRYWWHY